MLASSSLFVDSSSYSVWSYSLIATWDANRVSQMSHAATVKRELTLRSTATHNEDETLHPLEAVYPLLALRSLSTHVEDPVDEVAHAEFDFGDSRGLDSGANDVFVCWDVVARTDALDFVEEARKFTQRATSQLCWAQFAWLGAALSWVAGSHSLRCRVVELHITWIEAHASMLCFITPLARTSPDRAQARLPGSGCCLPRRCEWPDLAIATR